MKAAIRKLLPGSVQPTATDLAYRKTTNRLGAALLVFYVLFIFLKYAFDPVIILAEHFLSEDAAYVVEDICYSLDYLLSFLLPAAFFYIITPRRERVPMMLSPKISRSAVWLILAGIAINSACAMINARMVSVFGYGGFSSDVLWEESTLRDFEGVLLFISSAVVPAFSEELLFRGVVCNNLRPYGKTVAIIGSAVLFGMMHGNVGQLFYATMGGVLLAVIYLETGSIWASILLHLFNNLTSVVYEIVGDRLEMLSNYRIVGLVEATVIGLGTVALIWMIVRAERLRGRGASSPPLLDGRWAERMAPTGPVSSALRVRYFLSPLMLAFLVLTTIDTLWLLSIALRYSYG